MAKKKLSTDSKQFIKEAANLALSRVELKQCRDCGHPVIDGYCCTFCGSTNPSSRNDETVWIEL